MSIQSVTAQPPVMPTATAATAAGGTLQPPRSVATGRADSNASEALSNSQVQTTNPTEQRAQLEAAVKAVKEFIQPMTGNLEFSMDEETGETVIKITDASTKELIRQIPSKEMLEIAQALDRLQGLLVKQQA